MFEGPAQVIDSFENINLSKVAYPTSNVLITGLLQDCVNIQISAPPNATSLNVKYYQKNMAQREQ